MKEVLELNKDNLATDSYLSVLSNLLESFNEELLKEDLLLADKNIILTQVNEAYSLYAQLKNTLLDDDVSRVENLQTELNTLITSIQSRLDNGDFKGDIGLTGAKGDKGDKGDIGLTGAKGDKGDIGLTGAKGDKGDTGLTGAKGSDGVMTFGDLTLEQKEGLIGAKGEKGDKGDTGLTGSKGDKGDKGDIGLTGAKGDKGADGNDAVFDSLSDEQKQTILGDAKQSKLLFEKALFGGL